MDEDKLIPSYQKMSRSSSSVSQRVDSPVSPSVDFLTPCVVTFHDVRFGPNFGTRDFVADEFFDLRAVVSVRNKGGGEAIMGSKFKFSVLLELLYCYVLKC